MCQNQNPFKYPVKIITPKQNKQSKNNGLVISVPHSGREYTANIFKQNNPNLKQWRYFEDPFVDLLFLEAAISLQIPLIKARFPRAWTDPNRPKNILDPKIKKNNQHNQKPQSQKWIRNGLGVIPTKIPKYGDIYTKPISYQNAQNRIKNTWKPYHHTLIKQTNIIRKKKIQCLLIDAHSMPANINADIILGTQHNTSCPQNITRNIEKICRKNGFNTQLNIPFAGGYITEKFGKGKIQNTKPVQYQWAIQIEINRALYMNEKTFRKNQNFTIIRKKITQIIREINRIIKNAKPKP